VSSVYRGDRIDYSAFAGRARAGRPTVPLALSAKERARLEQALRLAKAEQRLVRRAQAVLMMADGVPATDFARLVGVHVRTGDWRKRFDCAAPARDWRTPRAPDGRPLSLGRRSGSATSACPLGVPRSRARNSDQRPLGGPHTPGARTRGIRIRGLPMCRAVRTTAQIRAAATANPLQTRAP
jgi:hypothetical protein